MSHFIYPLPHQCSAIIIKNMDSFSTLRSFMTALAILDPMKFNEIKDIIQRCIYKSNPFIREIIEINNNIGSIVKRADYMKYMNRLCSIANDCVEPVSYTSIIEARKFCDYCPNADNKKFKNITRTVYSNVTNYFNDFVRKHNGFQMGAIKIPFNYSFHSFHPLNES